MRLGRQFQRGHFQAGFGISMAPEGHGDIVKDRRSLPRIAAQHDWRDMDDTLPRAGGKLRKIEGRSRRDLPPAY